MMIRTTIRLDEALMKRAKREALRRGETFTALVDEGIRLALARGRKEARRRKISLPVCRAGGGTLPGVDLDSNAALIEIMEDRA